MPIDDQTAGDVGVARAILACLFDLDGVLTQTARLHAAAWKETFDAFLRARAAETGEAFVPFDAVADYDEYVDGKPRFGPSSSERNQELSASSAKAYGVFMSTT